MVSIMAKEDIECMKAEGLNPTVDDIVRLNVFGLKIDEKRKMNQSCQLHRISILSEDVSLRQPTIGHEIWLSKISRFIDTQDFETDLAVTAFALSQDHRELPSPDSLNVLTDCITRFQEKMKDYSKEQIELALDYVIRGCEPKTGERVPRRKATSSEDNIEDWNECVAIGVLKDGIELKLGLTLAEMKQLTQSELQTIINNIYMMKGTKREDVAQREVANYYMVLDDIRDRLSIEKASKQG